MKKSVVFAAFALALTAASAFADEIKFPSDEPVASITFPDGWGEKETESGIDATSPDEAIYISIDVAEAKDTDAVVKDAVTYLASQGVTVDTKSAKETKGKLNGMDVGNVDWDGTDKDGPVTIGLAAVAVNAETVLVVTYWGTKGEQDKNAEAMGAIINSLKPVN